MALTDWPSVILVVEVTGKKLENSQPSLRNRGNVCGIHTSLNTFSCVTSTAGTIRVHDLAEGWLRGAIHDQVTTSQKDTLTRHEATLALSTT